MRRKFTVLLIAVPTLWYALVPPAVDLGSTHIFNPHWPGHARFHMMWLLVLTAFIALTALYLMFRGFPDRIVGTRIAAVLSLCVYAGFFLSAISMDLYGGTLQDEHGVDQIMGVNANLFVFLPLTAMLLMGSYLAFTATNAGETDGRP